MKAHIEYTIHKLKAKLESFGWFWHSQSELRAIKNVVAQLEDQLGALKTFDLEEQFEAKIEALEGEIKASEDGSGITNLKDQFEAQLNVAKTCYNCGYTS